MRYLHKYKNTYHRTIKMKPVDYRKKINDKDPKFKIGDHVIISKYQNIFTKGNVANWPEEDFLRKKS